MKSPFDQYQSIYFAGIGGIGMSGLAQLLHADGFQVRGSDIADGEMVRRLRDAGINVEREQTADAVRESDLIIYSDALPEDHIQRQAAHQAGIPTLSYFEAVGQYAKQFDRVIAISGTHGKSTTTAMTAAIFIEGGLQPTVLVGSILASGSNVVAGDKKIFIVEACEHNAHMLNIAPTHVVITNIEADHLDFYRDLEHIEETFRQWVTSTTDGGGVVTFVEVASQLRLAERPLRVPSRTVVRCGPLPLESLNESTCESIAANDYQLQVPGRHNIENAKLAATVAKEYGIAEEAITHALESYTGIWRRFELKGTYRNAPVISDYAHHPTEIAATIQAARERYPNKRIVAVFQPHQKRRTQELFDDFVTALAQADQLIVQEIYDVAGREEDIAISAQQIVDKIDQAVFAANAQESQELLDGLITASDVLLVMGAGDIHMLTDELTQQ